jgi:hypothetical protein
MARPPLFDGETYDEARDRERLAGQLMAVFHLMQDRQWRTLHEIASALGYPEASISARLRDLRKSRFGSYEVKARYVRRGLWKYKVLPPAPDEEAEHA